MEDIKDGYIVQLEGIIDPMVMSVLMDLERLFNAVNYEEHKRGIIEEISNHREVGVSSTIASILLTYRESCVDLCAKSGFEITMEQLRRLLPIVEAVVEIGTGNVKNYLEGFEIDPDLTSLENGIDMIAFGAGLEAPSLYPVITGVGSHVIDYVEKELNKEEALPETDLEKLAKDEAKRKLFKGLYEGAITGPASDIVRSIHVNFDAYIAWPILEAGLEDLIESNSLKDIVIEINRYIKASDSDPLDRLNVARDLFGYLTDDLNEHNRYMTEFRKLK